MLDYGTNTEKVFNCGASSKDAGKKVCSINVIENTALVHPIIDALLLNPDKTRDYKNIQRSEYSLILRQALLQPA